MSAGQRLTVPELYNSRAPAYDDETTFHRSLASEYVNYANPKPGEYLLDLACGTGLVTYEFAHVLQPDSTASTSTQQRSTIIGVDISSGMLEVAREKLSHKENAGLDIQFIQHDITDLDAIEELKETKQSFDIITICSALVLLDSPFDALKHWVTYLKPGGRLIVDVPSIKTRLALKILGDIAPEFGIKALGGESRWIKGPESLKNALEGAGLVNVEATETRIFSDIPARTKVTGSLGDAVWTVDEGNLVFDTVIGRGGLGNQFRGLGEATLGRARARFLQEWKKAANEDGLVKEEGRLYVGVGRKTQ